MHYIAGLWLRLQSYFSGPRKPALLLTLPLLGLLVWGWWQAGEWYRGRLLAEQRGQVAAIVTAHRNALALSINRRFARLTGLKAFAETTPNLDEYFTPFAAGLYANDTAIRNFAVAPGGVQQYVFPLTGNELVAGHNLLNDERPGVRADVRRAIQTGQVALSGPYELRQGGLGLVARQAVYRQGNFWGLVTMVLDLPPLLAESGLDAPPGNINLALADSAGRIIFGPPQVFEDAPVVRQITLPEGYWNLGGIPAGGWEFAIQTPLLGFRAIGLVVVGLLTGLVYLGANRQARLAQAIRQQTATLAQTNQTLQLKISQLEQAEERIRKLNRELEQRVAERTAALNRRVAQVEALNDSMHRVLAELEAAKTHSEAMTRQLTIANTDLETFVYSVSHDLRAPLRSINGFSQILLRHHSHNLDEEARHFLNNVIQASIQMDHLINDLLAYTRLGRKAVRRQKVNLKEILDGVTAGLAAQIIQANANIHVSCPLPHIQSNATLLHQILANLLENALTYHRPDAPPEISVTCQLEDQAAVIRVSDNGIGIPAEYRHKIFNVFQRLHGQAEYPGTGIGLAIVQKSAGLLGGAVGVESTPGQGSTFWVRLPLSGQVLPETAAPE